MALHWKNPAFTTPSLTPRPQNRPLKIGKLTPWKNPSTTGSAGRSDPARDASSDPGPFTCSFFTPPNLPPTGRVGGFLFFLPNSPLCGPNRPLTGRSGRFPHLGQKPATRGFLGAKRGPWAVLWDGWLWGPVPEGTQGTQNSARGEGAKFASLARAFQRVQGGNAHQCTLQFTHNM